jgi:hypothetical protein
MTRDVTAAVVGTRIEAQLMAEMLRSNGVAAWVSTDDAGGVEAALQAQGVRVMVPFADAGTALRLVGNAPPEHGELNAFQRWVVRLLGGRAGAPRQP